MSFLIFCLFSLYAYDGVGTWKADAQPDFDCNYRDSGWENCFTTFEEATSRRRSIGDGSTDSTVSTASRDLASRQLTDWELRLNNRDGYDRALAHAGMLPEWVELGDFALTRMNSDATLELYWTWYFSSFPVKNESMEVQNPKDIVTHGLPNIPSLRSDMQKTKLEIIGGMYVGGDPRDAALAYAPTVFIMQQAVDSMKQAKEIGKQEEKDEAEEERKRKENFIMLIISVVLIVSVLKSSFLSFLPLAAPLSNFSFSLILTPPSKTGPKPVTNHAQPPIFSSSPSLVPSSPQQPASPTWRASSLSAASSPTRLWRRTIQSRIPSRR